MIKDFGGFENLVEIIYYSLNLPRCTISCINKNNKISNKTEKS